MEKYSLTKLCYALLMPLMFGCQQLVPEEEEKIDLGLDPIWTTLLPGEAGIYNDGMEGLPVWNNKIIFHSTYFTSSTSEDNRIHFLDANTGMLDWTFPQEFSKSNPMFFWGIPYLYEDKLVSKMPVFEDVMPQNRVLGLDLQSKQQIWSIDFPKTMSAYSPGDVCGEGNDCYFGMETANSVRIYNANVLTGDTSCIVEFKNPAGRGGVELSTKLIFSAIGGQKFLYFSILDWISDQNGNIDFENYFVAVDLSSNQVKYKIHIPKTEYFAINELEIDEEFAFMTSGRNCSKVNISTGEIIWNYYANVDIDYITTGLCMDDDILLLYGHNRILALNRSNGEKLYVNENVPSATATISDGVAYVIGKDAKLYYLDVSSGLVLKKIKCPESISPVGTGFQTGCKPRVLDGKVFVFGNSHAYCYPTYNMLGLSI